jgi:hypothetical protein
MSKANVLQLTIGDQKYFYSYPKIMSRDEFLLRHNSLFNKKGYQCKNCYGSGWMYDPKSKPCPVEGMKLADKVNCTKCNGTGDMGKEAFDLLYEKYKRDTRS